MNTEFNTSDDDSGNLPNPHKTENKFLLASATTLMFGAVLVVFCARSYFLDHQDKIAAICITLGLILFSTALSQLTKAFSQLRFFLGRRFPVGLAPQLANGETGVSEPAKQVMHMLRSSAIEFPEPKGAVNGILYSLCKPLLSSPPPIQVAAADHFHSFVGRIGILISLGIAFVFSHGSEYEGMISWFFLPVTGLSLITPLMGGNMNNLDVSVISDSDQMLWKLGAMFAFSVVAPVAIPHYMPVFHVPPLWVAPLLLLLTSIVVSYLFLMALISQLDSVSQTSVSIQQSTISMNCHPIQLFPKLSRDLQEKWVRGTPNRSYANMPPERIDPAATEFQGYLLEETQPTAFLTMAKELAGPALGDKHLHYIEKMGWWNIFLSCVTSVVSVYGATQFGEMARFEISRLLLAVIALGISSILTTRAANLLWSRLYFKSRLYFVGVEGTLQESEMNLGNQFIGNVQSRSKVSRVEDATLRVYVSDIVSVAFGRGGHRFVIALTPAAKEAAMIVQDLKEFAANQSPVMAPTSQKDLVRAASLGQVDAVMRRSAASVPDMAALIPGFNSEAKGVIQ